MTRQFIRFGFFLFIFHASSALHGGGVPTTTSRNEEIAIANSSTNSRVMECIPTFINSTTTTYHSCKCSFEIIEKTNKVMVIVCSVFLITAIIANIILIFWACRRMRSLYENI